MTSHYAAQTTVPVNRSRDEIERTLTRFGASQSAWLRDNDTGRVTVAFKRKGRAYKFSITTPRGIDKNIAFTPSGKYHRNDSQIAEAIESETRRRFRSLANYLKAVLDAIDTGIITSDEALLPYLLLPSGETVAEHLEPQIERMLESGTAPNIAAALNPGAEP